MAGDRVRNHFRGPFADRDTMRMPTAAEIAAERYDDMSAQFANAVVATVEDPFGGDRRARFEGYNSNIDIDMLASVGTALHLVDDPNKPFRVNDMPEWMIQGYLLAQQHLANSQRAPELVSLAAQAHMSRLSSRIDVARQHSPHFDLNAVLRGRFVARQTVLQPAA